MNIISRKIDGLTIGQRDKDGYVNATAMCRAAERKLSGYLRTDTTEAFLQALSTAVQICTTDLVQIRQGGRPENQGTWVHPQVAINLGQWCSADFAVLVTQWVMDWMMLSALGQTADQPFKLPEHKEVRQEGKFARRKFTDAIQDYMTRHVELSDDSRQWMYVNASDAVNRVVFGKTARELCIERNAERSHLRDSMSTEEVMRLKEVESLSMRLIDQNDMHPCPAAREAGERLMLSQCKRVRGLIEEKPRKVLTPVFRYR